MQIKKSKEIKILIVDDEESIVNFLKASMEDDGFTVLEETKAEAAVETCRKERPDLVILDYRMPAMSGIDALRRIREWDAEKAVLAVMISAYGADMSDADRGVLAELDVKDFIPKGVSLFEAKERIFKVIRSKFIIQ